MERIVRSRARVPAVNCGSGATSSRLDRHLAVLGGPAAAQHETAEATSLMREITTHDATRHSRGRTERVSLLAPLRRLRRTLFGGR
ncbi:hypothetical protein [Streptomyces odontomachi]|uniref:hypothetical protein n=1 Tax=Streptomyces odontomachi TaxID=2944940 RepID=UPI002108FF6C|nr:hypothetical protein [Streptomyces sp. ODS25]